ncbi:hypothetical protein Tco_0105018 [Tanacetum coccineum]
MVRDRQKSYADKRRKPLKFNVGDRVLLKVSPWKGVVRFDKKGKLSQRLTSPQNKGETPIDVMEQRFKYQVMNWQSKTSPMSLIGQDTKRNDTRGCKETPKEGILLLNLVQKKHKYSNTRNATLAIRVLTYLIQQLKQRIQ